MHGTGLRDKPEQQWHSTSIPSPENIILETKIDDHNGCRNEGKLQRRGNLWWTPDGQMYVYYRPTHWRYP